jgi:N-acetylglucosaminyl-diphospho-decaprenol L-rhamnosyltransferase
MAGVDVVVVTYKSSETVADAVGPLTGLDWVNVIAVDNASGDGTVDLLRSLPVETIALEENGGFAHGCNAGWRAGSSPYVLFLNPDAQIQPEALGKLVEELDRDERIGAVAPRIEEPDGSLDYSLRRFPRIRSGFAQALFLHRVFPDASWVDEVIRDRAEYELPHPVEWVSGACFGARRSVLEQIGGMDESFFHYSEDVDLCARVWEAGYEVRYVPDALALHEGGASAPRTRLLAILAASRIRYSTKHDSAPAALAVRASVALGAATHVLVSRSTAARKGHLKALAVALKPLPAEPSHLVRGA